MSQKCKKCNKEFTSKEAFGMHNQSKHPQEIKKPLLSPKQKKKIKTGVIGVVTILAIIYLISFFGSLVKTLPPTTTQGHIEVNPSSHVLKEPMDIAVHKHMLEHADGKNRPGVIINYNCEDFSCKDGLVKKLEEFATEFPEHVYVAPFPNMDAKIVLTKLNKQKVLEKYNKEVIENFMG